MKKFKNNDKKIEAKEKEKNCNSINKNYITYNNAILFFMIKFIIIITNLFYRIRSNTYDLKFFYESKIALKVKGNGEKLFINEKIASISYLKSIYINKNKQNNQSINIFLIKKIVSLN